MDRDETKQGNAERSEGDGMEFQAPLKEPTSEDGNTTTHLILLPKPHVVKQRSSSINKNDGTTTAQCIIKRREPKFIPYEPYKAAVTPLPPPDLLDRNLNLFRSGLHFRQHEKAITANQVHLEQCSCAENTRKLEEEIESLKHEKAALEKQLNIQTQVNNDLKKLLVASVGEDMQTKVQYLTEDKTKLAHDIVHYSQKMIDDSEHLEKLSIQCDVWRSKYLASSVMVDELANWKAILRHYLDDALGVIKTLLDEHESLSLNVNKVFSYLQGLGDKYGLGLQAGPPRNVLQVAQRCENVAKELFEKSIGSSSKHVSSDKPAQYKTPGEQLGFQLIALLFPYDVTKSEAFSSTGHRMTCAFQCPYKSIMPRFHPNVRYEHLTFNCCYHCRGDIKLM